MSEEDLMHTKADHESTGDFCNGAVAEFTKVTREEESNALLSKSLHNSIDKCEIIPEMKYLSTDTNSAEDVIESEVGLDKDLEELKKERNLYPNVLIAPSRDHSDVDTDEEDFQLRNGSKHRRNDSGQGSSITESSIGNDVKKIDSNDEEQLEDTVEHSVENDCIDAKSCMSQTGKCFDDNVATAVSTKVPDLDENVTEVLNKIKEGSEEVLSKSRTTSIISVKSAMNDAAAKSAFDETDFTDIPLDSPSSKSNMNTYAPRLQSSNDQDTDDDIDGLKKPAITDTKRNSRLKLFRKDQNTSWRLFGNHPIRINNERTESNDRRSLAGSKKAALATSTTGLIFENRPSNLPPKSAKEERHHRQLYNEMLKGAKKKEEKDMSQVIWKTKQQHKQEYHIASSLKIWKDEILVNWEAMRNTKKVRDLWWNGLPSSVRGKVWKLAIGNDLRITPELFQILQAHAQEKIASQRYQEPVATLHDSESSLVVSKENTVGLISLDVARTFPALCIFQKGGPYHQPLINLLGAYTCYRPDVGYVQGMSFIAAMLLLNMETVDAFICFANIMHKPCQMAFFMVNQPMMEAYFKTFDTMLEECCPKIHQHLKEQKLSHDIYLIDWIFSLYSKSLPLDAACRVWDLFCRDGEDFLFRAALGILNLYQEMLFSLDFFHLAQYLTKLSNDVLPDKLFQSIAAVNFSRQRFYQVLNANKSKVEESNR